VPPFQTEVKQVDGVVGWVGKDRRTMKCTDAEKVINSRGLPFGVNVLFAIAISYTGHIAAFASSVLIARLVGVEGKGVFSLFTEGVFGLIVFSSLGISDGQVYHVSKDPEKIKHFIPNAYVFSATLGVAGGLLYYVGGMFWQLRVVNLLGWTAMVLGIVLSPVMLMHVFQRQYFLATHAYKRAKANFASEMILPLAAYLILYVLGRISMVNLMIAFVVSQVLTLVLFQVLITKSIPPPGSFSAQLAKRSLSFGIRQYMSQLLQYLTYRLDFFLVAWFLGPSGLGIYSVAVALAEICSRLTHEIGSILFPAFASGVIPVGRRAPVLRKTLFVALTLAFLVELVSRPLILVLFGNRFEPAVVILRVLLFGTVALSSTYVTWSQAAASGRPALGAPIFGAAAFLDVILNIILLPRFGIMGAGIAAVISYWVAALLFLRSFTRMEKCSLREAVLVKSTDIADMIRSVTGAVTGLGKRLSHRAGIPL
jgi:O-antigen/teichoic acid export membrane protein